MFTLYRMALASARKLYREGVPFTHKKGDFGAISVTEPRRVLPFMAYTGRLHSKGVPFLGLGIYTWIFETPGWQKYQLILLVGNLKQ